VCSEHEEPDPSCEVCQRAPKPVESLLPLRTLAVYPVPCLHCDESAYVEIVSTPRGTILSIKLRHTLSATGPV